MMNEKLTPEFIDTLMARMRNRDTREWLAMPQWIKEELLGYVEYGNIEPNTTLHAALQNDFKFTMARASRDVFEILRELMIVIVNYIPAWSQGSPEAVEKWIKQGGLRGLQK